VLLAAALCAGCSGDFAEPAAAGVPTKLRCTVTVAAGAEASVARALANGPSLAVGDKFGLFVCRHETTPSLFVPHFSQSDNMIVTVADAGYTYAYKTFPAIVFPSVYLNDGNYTADCYAYAPWQAGADSPAAIAGLTFPTATDYLYAAENASATSNKDMAVNGVDKTASFSFLHALACVRVQLKYINYHERSNCTNLVLSTPEGGTVALTTKGTLNALTGAITPVATGANSGVTASIVQLTTEYQTYAEWLIPPTGELDDKGLNLQFYFNGLTRPEWVLNITKAMTEVTDTSGTHTGFLPGRIYTFQLTLDSYCRITGIQISTSSDWTTEEPMDFEI